MGTIPVLYTGEGSDISPPLSWTGAPEGTREFALICDDPDAPTPEPWVHWVLYKIPPDANELPEAVSKISPLQSPFYCLQGENSWPPGENIGYGGPYPPKGHGTHRYYFKLYALNEPLEVESGLGKNELLEKMQGKILAQAELIGVYKRD